MPRRWHMWAPPCAGDVQRLSFRHTPLCTYTCVTCCWEAPCGTLLCMRPHTWLLPWAGSPGITPSRWPVALGARCLAHQAEPRARATLTLSPASRGWQDRHGPAPLRSAAPAVQDMQGGPAPRTGRGTLHSECRDLRGSQWKEVKVLLWARPPRVAPWEAGPQ